MQFFSFLLLFIFLTFCKGKYCKGDQCANLIHVNNVTINLKVINRSRFGFTLFTFSKNESFLDTYDFITYVKNNQIVYYYFINKGNLTFKNPTTKQDNLITKVTSLYQFPISNYMNFLGQEIFMNSSLLSSFLNISSFWIKLQMNVYAAPSTPTTFEERIDEVFTFLVSNETEDILNPVNFDLAKMTVIHPAWFGINLFYFVALTFFCIIFWNKQPLKSRGVVPYLSILIHILMELSNIFIFFPLEVLQKSEMQVLGLYYFINMYLGSLTAITYLEVILLGRYVIIMFLNKRKLYFETGEKFQVVSMKWYWRVLKKFGHPVWSLVFFVPFCFILCVIFSTAGFLGDNRYFITFIIGILLSSLSAFVLLIFDCTINYKKGANCLTMLQNFWKEDLLFLKFEIYILGLGILLPIYIIKSLCQILNQQTCYLIGNTFMIYNIAFLQIIFPLALTIYTEIRNYILSFNDHEGDLSKLLNDKEGFKLIKLFANMEYSAENLICYESIQTYKTLKTQEEMLVFLKDFIILYLNSSESELEINLSRDDVIKLEEEMKNKTVTNKSLDKIETSVKNNIGDIFQRFRRTGEYFKWVKEKSIIQEI